MNGKFFMLIFTVLGLTLSGTWTVLMWKTLRLDIERRDVLDQFEKIGKVITRKLLMRKKVEKVRR